MVQNFFENFTDFSKNVLTEKLPKKAHSQLFK